MKKFSDSNIKTDLTISGWGRKNFVRSKLANFKSPNEIQNFLDNTSNMHCIPRGLGRSYGDAAQLSENYVLNLNFFDGIFLEGNEVTVGSGVSNDNNNEKIDMSRLNIPLSRLAIPDDVVNAVLFLTSPESKYISGSNIDVNGGR